MLFENTLRKSRKPYFVFLEELALLSLLLAAFIKKSI